MKHIRVAATAVALAVSLIILAACSGSQAPTEAQIIDAVKYGADALRALYGCDVPTTGETTTVGGAPRRAVDTSWMSGADALLEYVEDAFTADYFSTESARTRMFDKGPYFEDENGVLWVRVDADGASDAAEAVPDFNYVELKVIESSPGYAQAIVASKDGAVQRTFTIKSRTDVGQPTRFVVSSYFDVESPAAQ